MGTAGAIYHFKAEILRGNPSEIFVIHGDIASSFPLGSLLISHKRAGAIGTILSIPVKKEETRQYGCVVVDPSTKMVQHFVEKPETFVSNVISCGIYVFHPNFFNYIANALEKKKLEEQENGMDYTEFKEKASLAASNSALSARVSGLKFGVDLFSYMAENNVLYAHVIPENEFWMTIKTGASTISANRRYLQYFMRDQPRRLSQPVGASPARTTITPEPTSPTRNGPQIIAPAFIHQTAVVHPTARIGPNAFIGARALIGRGVRVRDSIILDAVEIKPESCIINSVVGWESRIGAWVRVEGAAPDTRDSESATEQGFKIHTAVIMGKGVTVADEVVVRNCIVLPHKEIKKSFQNEILM